MIMKFTKKLHKDQKGLTLIELLAVIVILGIIAAIAIPSVNSIIKNSEAKAQIENAKLLISTARMAVADRTFEQVGRDSSDQGFVNFPSGTEPAEAGSDWVRTVRQVTIEELKERGYLDANLIDPQTREAYDESGSFVTIVMDEKKGAPGDYAVQWHYLITLKPNAQGADPYYNFVLEADLANPQNP
ncbi:hypothetical protein PRECH8_16550 [Insulibacter thermoxylanivorax]|uniref:Prepilin-type N-terminal cleavage/methylation domain-containing protein n=2 Tax=Insulibacter thermoxylanivorax TaxID=2749268 RepID=A0A916VG53_9BACL|nr:hypothetical protein PRECH8_16550 [Insulibacter thermoxylanivorax]